MCYMCPHVKDNSNTSNDQGEMLYSLPEIVRARNLSLYKLKDLILFAIILINIASL